MKLHYSQTHTPQYRQWRCFTTLWNYTTLKQCSLAVCCDYGFTTLWNYTTLKQIFNRWRLQRVLLPYEITLLSNIKCWSFNWFMFYYLMKLHYSQTVFEERRFADCFTTLWNYTTLKHSDDEDNLQSVLLPYEITLLSNFASPVAAAFIVLLPYEITLLSNLKWK